MSLQTKTYCPVCYREVTASICPVCATPLSSTPHSASRRVSPMKPDTLHVLTDALHRNRHESGLRAVSLANLGLYWWRLGRWRLARMYLEAAMSERPLNPAFLAAVQRQLGMILVRSGEEILGKNLLQQALAAGDFGARREWMRLAIDARDFESAKRFARELETVPYFDFEAHAWRMEIMARQGDPAANDWATLTLLAAIDKDDDTGIAISRRALGLLAKNDYKEARASFEQAAEFFRRTYDIYELGQTLYELGRVCLRYGDLPCARTVLGEAASHFLNLGAIPAYLKTWQFLESLPPDPIDESARVDATRSIVALLWVELMGAWADEQRQTLHKTLLRQGGACEILPEGMLVLFGSQYDLGLMVETGLACYELLKPVVDQNQRDRTPNAPHFRVVAMTGMLPYEEYDLPRTLQTIVRTNFIRQAPADGQMDTILVDDTVYMETETRYDYAMVRGSEQQNPQWWSLITPYQHIKSNILPNRQQLVGKEDLFTAVDAVLDRLGTKKQGVLIMLEGEAGSGKTQLLDILRAEIRSTLPAMLIHLRGHPESRYEPFGVLREWLGEDIEVSTHDPKERQRAYLAAFHNSLLGVLRTRPVLLVIDNVHLLDSASLQALHAIFPLMAHYPLIMLLTSRPEARWQKLLQKVQRALGEQAVRLLLPSAPPPMRDDWPDEVAARRVLDCAAVLGREFSVRVLRQMTAAPDMTRWLLHFQQLKILAPTDDPHIWRFVYSEEREGIYRHLAPTYAALLHGYAWTALRRLDLPTHGHAHEAELHSVALPEMLQRLARVRYFDAPHEALVCYDDALMHQPPPPVTINLMLGRVEMLLEQGQLEAAEQTLRILNRKNHLTDEQYARLLYFQGELLHRYGEIPSLFRIYNNALAHLRADAPSVGMINLQIDLLYALAMARFRNNEIELARALLGTAVFKAEHAHLPYQLARLWLLLAHLHQARSNYQHAWKAIQNTLATQEQLGYRYCMAESHLVAGNLQEMMGSLMKAREHYLLALSRFEDTGNLESALHVRLRLAQGALHEGDFALMAEHLEEALKLAAFSESIMLRVQLHSTYAEGLALQGSLVAAFGQANLGIDLARRFGEKLALSEGYLALAKVARMAHWWDNAKEAVAYALRLIPPDAFALLRLRMVAVLMEVALAQGDLEGFVHAYGLTRDLGPVSGDDLVRARLNLLVGRYRLMQENWNMAAVEVEKAFRTFTRLGASFWLPETRDLLHEIMEKFHAENP